MTERPIDPLSGETGGTVLETGSKSASRPAASADRSGGLFPSRPRTPEEDASRSIRDAPVRGRELAAVLLLVVLADLFLYRGHGFAGYAAFLAAALLLLLAAAPQPKRSAAAVVGLMLLVLAAKLVWLGSGWLAAAGFLLLAAFAMSLAGFSPYVPDVFAYIGQAGVSGGLGLAHYWGAVDKSAPVAPLIPRREWLAVVLPALAVAGFGTLFVLANPEVATAWGRWFEWFFETLWDRARGFAPTWPEFGLWVLVAWMAVGLLRPMMKRPVFAHLERPAEDDDSQALFDSPWYAPFRNTLTALIVLFAAYLVFEFKTLWFKVFPEGFHYSGYAHEGAAWLTAALALATVVLSVIFREEMFYDPRLPRIRRLAWIWSVQNLLLAAAVYHRLSIYVGFNGMTRMRTVGLLGISAVVVGFILVVWKITRRRDFLWLMRRQTWALAVAIYLYAVLPVDYLVHSYNVRRILAGDPAPSVQISVHPIAADGLLVLGPLVECENSIVRDGVRALLAREALQVQARESRRQREDWTGFQLADRLLLDRLDALRPAWEPYSESSTRDAALARFHEYAYQWY